MSKFSYTAGDELGKQICEALGLNPNEVLKVVITMDAQEPIYVDVTTWVTDEKSRDFLEVISRYQLVPTDDDSM